MVRSPRTRNFLINYVIKLFSFSNTQIVILAEGDKENGEGNEENEAQDENKEVSEAEPEDLEQEDNKELSGNVPEEEEEDEESIPEEEDDGPTYPPGYDDDEEIPLRRTSRVRFDEDDDKNFWVEQHTDEEPLEEEPAESFWGKDED